MYNLLLRRHFKLAGDLHMNARQTSEAMILIHMAFWAGRATES